MKKIILAIIIIAVLGVGGFFAWQKMGTRKPAKKVDVTMHIMSKCPYGVMAVDKFLPVFEGLKDYVDYNIEYIGREQDGELTSMHGEAEVKGDVAPLCVKALSPDKFFPYLKCINKEWKKIPNNLLDCVKQIGIDEAKFNACYEGAEGKALLKKSFDASKAKMAQGSPTIFLGGKKFMGQRTDKGFLKGICRALKPNEQPKQCKDIPPPIKVSMTVLADQRCKNRRCNTAGFENFLTRTFEGLETESLDYSADEGKKLYEKLGAWDIKHLPVFVFDSNIEKDEGFKRLQRYLEKKDDKYLYAKGTWDPTSEICDNSADDTGNGLVDCADPTCQDTKVCRKEIKKRLDLFVMSQCPYGVKAVDAVEPVLKNFGNSRAKIDFNVHFIGNESGGKFSSLHGQPEVDENLRQICAQKLYRTGYKYMKYLLCRNKDYRKPDWQSCAKKIGPGAVVKIKACSEGAQGKKMLSDDFALSNKLEITGSPSWLLNNRFDMNGRDPESIKNSFCEKNAQPGCKNKLKAPAGSKKAPAGGKCG